ncbi:MAG: hypothetical protein ACI9HK_001968, partial [Pirellulaceae bacterium]
MIQISKFPDQGFAMNQTRPTKLFSDLLLVLLLVLVTATTCLAADDDKNAKKDDAGFPKVKHMIDTHIHLYDTRRPAGVPWPPTDDTVL